MLRCADFCKYSVVPDILMTVIAKSVATYFNACHSRRVGNFFLQF